MTEPEDLDEVDRERWLVVGGRRWRRQDPALPEDVAARLTSHLGRGRSGTGAARTRGDDEAVAAARHRTGLAKHGLGERGTAWWEQALVELDALDG